MSAARGPGWVGWIPALVLGAVTIGVIIAGAVLIRGGLGAPAPEPTHGQVTELNWSSFSEEGLAYIASTRDVRIDLSRPPVEAEPLGLQDDGTLVLERIDNADVTLDYVLIVNGGGESPGGTSLTVSEIGITTAGGLVTAVEAVIADVAGFRETLNRLSDESEKYGWEIDRDAVLAIADAATRAGEAYEFTAGPSSRLGMQVTATAVCETSGFCELRYVSSPVAP